MPQRSNQFQRLVASLEAFFAQGGGKVEESVMLRNAADEDLEADVVVTHEFGGRTYRLAIECRDHSRVQSVSWIREIVTKYEGTNIDKIIAVSNLGFSKKARALAGRHNIDCSVLERMLKWNWAEKLNGGFFTARRILYENPVGVVIGVEGPPPRQSESTDFVRTTQGERLTLDAFFRRVHRQTCEWSDGFLTQRPTPANLYGAFDMRVGVRDSEIVFADLNLSLPIRHVEFVHRWEIKSEPKRLMNSIYQAREFAVANDGDDQATWQMVIDQADERGLHEVRVDLVVRDGSRQGALMLDFGAELTVRNHPRT